MQESRISLAELQKYGNEEIASLRAQSALQRSVSYWADSAYCMCRLEEARRESLDKVGYMDLKCIHNIFSKAQEYIFRLGEHYLLHYMDDILVVCDGKLFPYRFTTVENDQHCVWKYFTVWKDGKFLKS